MAPKSALAAYSRRRPRSQKSRSSFVDEGLAGPSSSSSLSVRRPSKETLIFISNKMSLMVPLLKGMLGEGSIASDYELISTLIGERFEDVFEYTVHARNLMVKVKPPESVMICFDDLYKTIVENEDVLKFAKIRVQSVSDDEIVEKRDDQIDAEEVETAAEPVIEAAASTSWVGKKEDDDERFYKEFRVIKGHKNNLEYRSRAFLSADHKRQFDALGKRGAMQNRPVMFGDLDRQGVLLSEIFMKLKLTNFLEMNEFVHPQMVRYFYSNLHGETPDAISFSANHRTFTLTAEELGKLIGVEECNFREIPMTSDEAYAFLMEDPSFTRGAKKHVNSTAFPLRYQIVHRIVVHCIRPKASSIQDVSQYEAKLTAAIIKGIPFSLPHTIILGMHRAERKSGGALPYGSLINKIYQHVQAQLPEFTREGFVTPASIGSASLSKMNLIATEDGWTEKKSGRLLSFGGGREAEEMCLVMLRETLNTQPAEKKKKSSPKPAPSRRRTRAALKEIEKQQEEAEEEEIPLKRRKLSIVLASTGEGPSAVSPTESEARSPEVSNSSSEVQELEIHEDLRPLQTILPEPISPAEFCEVEEEQEDVSEDTADPTSDGDSSEYLDGYDSLFAAGVDEEEEGTVVLEEEGSQGEADEGEVALTSVEVFAETLSSLQFAGQTQAPGFEVFPAASSADSPAHEVAPLEPIEAQEGGRREEEKEEDQGNFVAIEPRIEEDPAVDDPYCLASLLSQSPDLQRETPRSPSDKESDVARTEEEPSFTMQDAPVPVSPKATLVSEQEAPSEGEPSPAVIFDQTPLAPRMIESASQTEAVAPPDPEIPSAETPAPITNLDIYVLVQSLQTTVQGLQESVQSMQAQINRVEEENARFQTRMLARQEEFFGSLQTFGLVQIPNPIAPSTQIQLPQPPPEP